MVCRRLLLLLLLLDTAVMQQDVIARRVAKLDTVFLFQLIEATCFEFGAIDERAICTF
jgi:hypothetical protein